MNREQIVAEKLIRSAAIVVARWEDPHARFLYGSTIMQWRIVRDYWEDYGKVKSSAPLAVPSPAEIDRCDGVLAVLSEVLESSKDQQIVILRAVGLPWWRLVKGDGRRMKELRIIYRDALYRFFYVYFAKKQV